MDVSNQTIRSSYMRFRWGLVSITALIVVVVVLVPLRVGPMAALFSTPVTTTVSIPFSGILATNLEDISITGILHLTAHVTLTRTSVFAEVNSNISNTTGVGTKSGQSFVGVGAELQMCAIPAGPRSSSPVPLQLTAQFRLLPSGQRIPLYQNVREGSLLLILQLAFRADGTLVEASVLVGNSRFTSIAPGFA
jgi:hypothetical protein